MVEFGWTNPVLIDTRGTIVAGHGRVMAARKLGMETVPCIRLGHLSPAQVRAYVIADNKLALNAGWDDAMLKAELDILKEDGFDISLTGFSEEDFAALLADTETNTAEIEKSSGSLSKKFGIPPFSVFNAREGWWQDCKKKWLQLGIKSELGRDEELVGKKSEKSAYGKQCIGTDHKTGQLIYKESVGNTSIFDPVLCELSYCWFCPLGGTIVDPFAGGSVRGIVASKLGRRYVGHELRIEQVSANRDQAKQICENDPMPPVWVHGDSRRINETCGDLQADMLITCPPYADLEVYSDDPADLSTLGYVDFVSAYREIIAKSCSLLVPHSFAVCVVGEVRDKKGNYVDFIGDTVQAFRDAGLEYYNEAILVTCVGSLPIRAGKQFSASRKLGKTHQNVLIFVKGDGKKAAARCGVVEIPDEIMPSDSGEPELAALPQ
jgi:hypothetical protein